jgi:hypothetical protein
MDKKNEFRTVIKKWFEDRIYTKNECYPFEDLSGLETEVQNHFKEWGIDWVGMIQFGETVTFGGEWIEEGRALEININPSLTGEGFRALIRWR